MSESDLLPYDDVHAMRFTALRQVFVDNIGGRTLILTAQFPFLFIGKILEVVEDFVRVDVETTHIEQLENRTWLLHIDTIATFYIEKPGEPPIPDLQ